MMASSPARFLNRSGDRLHLDDQAERPTSQHEQSSCQSRPRTALIFKKLYEKCKKIEVRY